MMDLSVVVARVWAAEFAGQPTSLNSGFPRPPIAIGTSKFVRNFSQETINYCCTHRCNFWLLCANSL